MRMFIPMLRTASREEAEAYFDWFVSTIPQRLTSFRELYRSTGGRGDLDLSGESLTELALWLRMNVEFRMFTEDEIQNSNIGVPEWLKGILRGRPILTDLWEERSVDIGTYVGALFAQKYPFLKWAFSSQSSGNANFQQPVLLLPSGYEFPVLMVAGSYMVGLQRPRDPVQQLLSVCETWGKNIEDDWRNANRHQKPVAR